MLLKYLSLLLNGCDCEEVCKKGIPELIPERN